MHVPTILVGLTSLVLSTNALPHNTRSAAEVCPATQLTTQKAPNKRSTNSQTIAIPIPVPESPPKMIPMFVVTHAWDLSRHPRSSL